MRGRRKKQEVDTELNITAFLNLMVVLIPFLLMSAAFTQMSILELNLPTSNQPPPPDKKKPKPKPSFEITVSKHFLLLGNITPTPKLKAGIIAIFPKTGEEHEFEALNLALNDLKNAYDDIENINILLEEETHYDTLIQAMDTTRLIVIEGEEYPLFPNVSIGDAPADAIAEQNKKLGFGG